MPNFDAHRKRMEKGILGLERLEYLYIHTITAIMVAV